MFGLFSRTSGCSVSLFRYFLTTGILLASLGTPAFGQIATQTAQARLPAWRQFDFQDGQRFSYDLSFGEGSQRETSFAAEIEVGSTDRSRWVARIRSGRAGAEQEVTVNFLRNQVQPLLEGGWARTVEQKVLLATTLLRLSELEGRELTMGNRWSLPDRDGTRRALVMAGCTEANIRGVAVELSGSHPLGPYVVACIGPEVPLALFVSVRSVGLPGPMFTARLRRYQPATPARGSPSQPPVASALSERALDGLYLGVRGKDGIEAASYIFRPSGKVVVSAQAFLDPDAIGPVNSPGSGPPAWRLTDRFPRVDPLDPNPPVTLDFGCRFGAYALAEGSLRLRTRPVQVDVTRRTVYYNNLPLAGSPEQEETLPFRSLKGADVIQIDGTVLTRQGDFTGYTLEAAKLESIVFNPAGESRLIEGWFRADGTFVLKRMRTQNPVMTMGINQLGPLVMPGTSESQNQGRYQIRGHEILFYSPDGKVERKLFGHLGKSPDGKERVVIGDLVCPVDRFR